MTWHYWLPFGREGSPWSDSYLLFLSTDLVKWRICFSSKVALNIVVQNVQKVGKFLKKLYLVTQQTFPLIVHLILSTFLVCSIFFSMYVGGLKPYGKSIFRNHSIFVLLWTILVISLSLRKTPLNRLNILFLLWSVIMLMC